MKRPKRQAKTTDLTVVLKQMRKTTISRFARLPTATCQEASKAAGLGRNQMYDYETGRVVPTFFKLQQAVAVYGYEIQFKKTGIPKV